MAIPHALLALLATGPRSVSRLRAEFEARTAAAWPLHLGRVCAALGRLERDGLVVREGVDRAGRATYALTEAGRVELGSWYTRPVEGAEERGAEPPGEPAPDELTAKLVLAVGAPGVDVREIVDAQRRHVSEALQDRVRQRAEVLARLPEHAGEVARLLVLEQSICRAEAESRWLDHCAARLERLARPADSGGVHTVDHPPRGAPRR
ncbi:helix-turn-helix transcriptional regulator [Streptomyces sp. NPDC021356]|uniref:PadR family transcriptional regulator n=1 Tax=Streptomyces sp. NPDC021356 TaxID=3154900 RepID=UPI0033DF59E7